MKRRVGQLEVVAGATILLAMQLSGCGWLGSKPASPTGEAALPAPTHKKIVLHGVEFDRGRGTVKRASHPVLDTALDALSEPSKTTVVVVGPFQPHRVRTADLAPLYCRGMGVEDYFSAHGIDATRIGSVEIVDAPLPVDSVATRATKTCRVELDVH